MSEEEVVRVTHEGAVSIVTVTRPSVLNALNVEVLVALKRVADELASRNDTRAVVLTGAGDKAFVAGADIAAMQQMDSDQAKKFAQKGHAAMDAIAALPKPVIAAVNGFALGGGLELALACDFIYASERAKFGQPEVNLGILPGFGGTQRLSRRVSVGLARELIYTGAIIGADEALRIGLVNRLFPAAELLEAARKTAALIADKGPIAVRYAKRVIGEGLDNTLSDGNEIEVDAFAGCFRSDDRREGMAAFLEKRPAKFRGL